MPHLFGPCCAEAVRAALLPRGYDVHELPDWTVLGEGPLHVDAAVWHHDASAEGFSPGMAEYIQGQVRHHHPGANIWVGLDGGWRFLAAGVTFHAGKVLPGMPDNDDSAGIETDHTTGETWSGVVMLDSMRIGTAALVEHWLLDATALHFHKTICKPVGRKTDPDGLDLATERRAVAALQNGDDDMTEDQDKRLRAVEMRTVGIQADLAEIKNTLAGYGTTAGKRDSKVRSLIGRIGDAVHAKP